MNFKMNIVVCVMMLATSKIGEAVYLYDIRCVKYGIVKRTKIPSDKNHAPMCLAPAAPRPPVEHYGDLTATLLQLPTEDIRDISPEPSRPISAPVVRKNSPIIPCSSPRPPVELYGELMARLLQLPKEDKRDISFEPSRPVSAPVVRRNAPIKPCPSARRPCIISNGSVVYRIDEMVQERKASPKKSN